MDVVVVSVTRVLRTLANLVDLSTAPTWELLTAVLEVTLVPLSNVTAPVVVSATTPLVYASASLDSLVRLATFRPSSCN
jgi:hypothetical protein